MIAVTGTHISLIADSIVCAPLARIKRFNFPYFPFIHGLHLITVHGQDNPAIYCPQCRQSMNVVIHADL